MFYDQNKDDDEGLDIPKEAKIRLLAINAARLISVFDSTWATYLELFKSVGFDDIKANTKAVEAIEELEFELSEVLEHIRGQLRQMATYDEPIPTQIVEDFESSVLTTLAGLDKIDLESYRRKM